MKAGSTQRISGSTRKSLTKELALYKKAGTVWISYAVPFIIPITAGLITAIIFGDFLLAIMTALTGGA